MTSKNENALNGRYVFWAIVGFAALASLLFWGVAARPGGRLGELVAARALAKDGGVRLTYRVDFGRAAMEPTFARLPEAVRMEAAANALRERLKQIDATGVVTVGDGERVLSLAIPGTDPAMGARVRRRLNTAPLDGREGGLRMMEIGEEKVPARR